MLSPNDVKLLNFYYPNKNILEYFEIGVYSSSVIACTYDDIQTV